MVDENTESSNEGFTRIEPASISLTTAPSPQNSKESRTSLKQSPFVWLGLGVLLTSALMVIFLLPRWVDKPEVAKVATTTADARTQATKPKPINKNKVSPWEKAQESQLRKETQEILSQMLEAEKVLSERGVEIWAAEDYARAMQFAATGDERYNERDFASSKAEYQKAQTIFSHLVEEMDIVYETTMEKGNQALEDGNSLAAKEAFDLALAMDAIDRAALTGRGRAETLDDVLALLNTADNLLDKGELVEAKLGYQQVLELDSHYGLAEKQIKATDQMILDRTFNNHMSIGFAALEQNRYSQARTAFNQALKLKPGAVEARTAIEQTNHKLTTVNIASLLSSARKMEEQELWSEALEKYRAALKLDSSLAEAQENLQFANLRDKLHKRLELILAQPERLYDPKVYSETIQFKNKLHALSNRGPILTRQLASLDQILNKADTPVVIRLQSDNMTRVTLRKAAELGLFLEKSMSLRPGKYVAVGIREGYRDVRIEFIVDPAKSSHTIIIQAAERIALGN
jgi:tetratricopeptide (TPR) repeat protein